MPRFVIVGHEAPLTDDFSLSNLPGGAGRLDLLARAMNSALLISHGIRSDTEVVFIIQNEITLRFDGGELKGLHPDERSTAARIRSALANTSELVGQTEIQASTGVYVRQAGFNEQLTHDSNHIVHLDPHGTPATTVSPPADPTFVLSDHRDFNSDERAVLHESADDRVSLGPTSLHTDDAIAVAHNWLETNGYQIG